MALETLVLSLDRVPRDLRAEPGIAAVMAAEGAAGVFVQNTSPGKTVVLAERMTAPAEGSRDGVVLRYGDGVALRLERDLAMWVWSTTTATVAVGRTLG